jgi:topoisomerase IV subunit A
MQEPDLFEGLEDPNEQPPEAAEEAPFLPLGDFAEQAYLAYAMSVVRGRALPQVEDGLKPVQRRILYAMGRMALSANSKHVKSARVVGDVIGKYHPHGDSSVYEAMVRVAQDFSLRYPLIDGQGNFGSRDGDSAAAMRYTECRLTPIARLLLAELDQGTVDFTANYDGAFEEPRLLPARLPFVLLNGASGIAVGMATEIPSHHLGEVVQAALLLIDKPEASLEAVMALLPGPDYPAGGQLISPQSSLQEAYATGRGSVRLRACWHIEELARGQWRVIIDELPQGVSCAQVLSEIEALTNPSPRTGKKELSPEQKQLKHRFVALLDTVRDESSDKAPIRLVIEPKSSRQDRDAFMAALLAHTSLEVSLSLNFTLMGRNGRPEQKPVIQILLEWLDFRRQTVERRSQFRLKQVQNRLEVLKGRQHALAHLDEVIAIIREDENPRAHLMARFGFSALQVDDILDLRLRQLARLETDALTTEMSRLEEEAGQLRHWLSDPSALKAQIKKELREDARLFGDSRRTRIQPAQPALARESLPLVEEPLTLIVSRNGWVRLRQGHGLVRAQIQYKSGDEGFVFLEIQNTWPCILLDTQGRAYTLKLGEIPIGRGDGVPIATLVDLEEGAKMAQWLCAPASTLFGFAHSGGKGFACRIAALVGRMRSGKAFMSLEAGQRILPPAPVQGPDVFALSSEGRLLIFPSEQLREQEGGQGLRLMKLGPDESLSGLLIPPEEATVRISGPIRGGKEGHIEIKPSKRPSFLQERAEKGVALSPRIREGQLA